MNRLRTLVAFTALLALLLLQVHADRFLESWQRTNPGGGGWFMKMGVGPDGRILAGSDLSGAFQSTDLGQSWECLGPARGLTHTHVCSFGFHRTNPDTFCIGTSGGIFHTTDGSASFTRVMASGQIETLCYASGNASVAYAGRHSAWNSSDGQIYRSEDAGATWRQVSGSLPDGLNVIDIQVATGRTDTVFVLTGIRRFTSSGAQRIYASLDGGDSWAAVSNGFGGGARTMAVDKFDPETIWASVDDPDSDLDSLYKSTDCGARWSYLSHRGGYLWLDAANPQCIRSVELSRTSYHWQSATDGIWESVDGGGSWDQVSSSADWQSGWSQIHWTFNGRNVGAAEDPTHPGRLYWCNSQFITATFDNGRTAMQLQSNEVGGSGSNWWQSTGVDNTTMMEIALSAADSNLAYVGFWDIGLWRTRDGGASWQACNHEDYVGNWNGWGGNTMAVVADPVRAAVVWASNSSHQTGDDPTFLVRSDDYGDSASWVLSNTGLPTVEVMGLSLDITSSSTDRTLFVTAQGDVYRSSDDGNSWTLVFDNDGCRFTAVDRFDGQLVYAGGESGLWRSTNGGTDWEHIGSVEMNGSGTFWGGDYVGVWNIETDPHASGRVYVTFFGSDKGLYRGTQNGTAWEKLYSDRSMRCVAVSPADPDILFLTSSRALKAGGYDGTSKGVLYSDDGGVNWEEINDGLSWPFATPIAVEPQNPDRVWVGVQGPGIHVRNLGATSAAPQRSRTEGVCRARGVWPAVLLDPTGRRIPAGLERSALPPGVYVIGSARADGGLLYRRQIVAGH